MESRAIVERYSAFADRSAESLHQDLVVFEQLLRKWQPVQNLVSRETLADVWTRHFADSLQVLPLLQPTDKLILDIGSGGGFPALPLAIAAKGSGRSFVLVEPNGRKVSFLRTVARELGLPVRVIDSRTEQIDSRETGTPDVVTSRALANLTQLCAWSAPFFGPQTRAIFHKGREHVEELAESGATWHHDVVITKSDTDPQGVLLQLSNLSLKNK